MTGQHATLDQPPRHRGRLALTEHIARIAAVTLWIAAALAVAAVISGIRPAWLMGVVLTLLLGGAIALAAARVRVRSRFLDRAVARLTAR